MLFIAVTAPVEYRVSLPALTALADVLIEPLQDQIGDLQIVLVLHRPGREQTRHARDVGERELRRGRAADGSAPSATGPSVGDISLAAAGSLSLRRLANLIARYAPHDGVFPLRLPGTYALRRARITSEPVHATLGPSLCIVAQGAKVMMLGSEVLEYDSARMLVFAVDLPVSGQVTRASRSDPFLGFKLDLVPARLAELAARVYPHGVPGRLTLVGSTSGTRPTPSSTPWRVCWISWSGRRTRISSAHSWSTRS